MLIGDSDSNVVDSGSDSLSSEVYRQVVTLLQLVRSSVGRAPMAMGLFLDELASAIHADKIHPKVEVSHVHLLFAFVCWSTNDLYLK